MKRIYLVDVSSLFFRAYYAIRPLTAPNGTPVNAIYGLMAMLVKLIKEEKPEFLVFCYDLKEPSFRKDLYAEYKAHRTETPEDLSVQIPYIKKIAELMGIPSVERPGFEADDVIGTLCELALKNRFEVYIVSGDKDFGQLVKPHVTLWDTMKDSRLDSLGVKAKWGIEPSQFIDYLALVGDTSDNIPGVEGIGPKGAQKLLEQFSSVEDIYERINEIESVKLREKLLKSKEDAMLSKKLVTIATDIPLDPNMETYRRREIHEEELRNLLRDLNFKTFEKSLLNEGVKPAPAANASPEPEVSVANQTAAVDATPSFSPGAESSFQVIQGDARSLIEKVDVTKPVWVHSRPQGVFFCQVDEHNKTRSGWIFALEGNLDFSFLGDGSPAQSWQWCGFDLKKIWHRLNWPVGQIKKVVWDGMLASYVLRAKDSSDFATIVKENLDKEATEFSSIEYLQQLLLELKQTLDFKLKEISGEQVLMNLDLPLVSVLYKMERRGIKIDVTNLNQFSKELGFEIKAIEKQIIELAGETFNVASPKQLGVILFQKLGLESIKKTKTGHSTDTDVLEKLNHPIAPLILEFRELSKLKSTYVDALPEMIDARDGRVHTNLNQALTATGRLSSINPNLQNIPIRTKRGQKVRQAFIAEQDCLLLSVDYSQIELRILAHISDDANLKRAFIDDLDIHQATAAEIFSVPLDQVTPDLRRAAKAVNFGIAYGQGAFGLAENLGIPRAEAQGIIKRYFERFRGVQDYMVETVKMAYEKGYVETLSGRRRYIAELQSKNGAIKKFGERAAINAPIQGTASDLVKKAMIDLDQKVSLPMLLQVHDELLFEGLKSEIEAELPEIKKIMESAANLRVPLKVNAGFGPNWDEAH